MMRALLVLLYSLAFATPVFATSSTGGGSFKGIGFDTLDPIEIVQQLSGGLFNPGIRDTTPPTNPPNPRYVCDCDTGNDAANNPAAGCTAGNNANAGTSPSAPWETYEHARSQFGSLTPPASVLFCNGGTFTSTSSTARWVNDSADANNRMLVSNYQPSWGSGSERVPLFQPSATSSRIFEPSDGGLSNHDGFITFENFKISGRGMNTSKANSSIAIQIRNDADGIIIQNGEIEYMSIGVHNANSDPCSAGDPLCDAENEDTLVQYMHIHHNFQHGILGAGLNSIYQDNTLEWNGRANILDHNAYLAGDSSGTIFRRNYLYKAATGNIEAGGTFGDEICNGASFTAHGEILDMTIEYNVVEEDAGEVIGTCFGYGMNPGYFRGETFTNVIIRGNVVKNVGSSGISLGSCQDCFVDSNVVINDAARSMTAIDGMSGTNVDANNVNCTGPGTCTGCGPGDSCCVGAHPNAGNTCDDFEGDDVAVRNNTILFTAITTGGTGIANGRFGDENNVHSNLVINLSTVGSFDCFDYTNTSNIESADHNWCYTPNSSADFESGNTLAAHQAATTFDDNSTEDVDPEVADTATLDVGIGANDSPLIDGGHATLSSTVDRWGFSRTGTPDIGAYETGLAEPSTTVDNADSWVGMNLQRNYSHTPGIPFANALKTAERWFKADSGSGVGADDGDYTGSIDANGYPTGLGSLDSISTRIGAPSATTGGCPEGEWVLRWAGTATFTVGERASNYSASGNRATFDVGGGDGATACVQINITSGTPTDIRVYPPMGVIADNASAPYVPTPTKPCSVTRCSGGVCPNAVAPGAGETCEDIEDVAENDELTFYPLWVSRLTEYRALRFMDWLHTNGSFYDEISDLLTESHFSWEYNVRNDAVSTNHGNVPLTVIAELCNILDAECWVNVPHQFSDAAMTSMAQTMRDEVTTQTVIVEYGNETWNGLFPHWDDLVDQAIALPEATFTGDDCVSTVDNFTNRLSCNRSYHGMRTYQMADLFETAFDATSEDARLIVIHAAQAGSTSKTQQALDCTRWNTAPSGDCYTGSNVDGFAITHYFGGESACDDETTLDGLFGDQRSDLETFGCASTGASCQVPNQEAVLSARSLTWPIYAYEGGSSSAKNGSQLCADYAFRADSLIRHAYTEALDAWKALDTAGYDVRNVMLFNSGSEYTSGRSAFGTRGSMEGAWPKESGILNWVRQSANDCPWTGC